MACWGIVGEDVTRNINSKLFVSITQQEISFFDQHSTGEIANNLSSDIAVIHAGGYSINFYLLIYLLLFFFFFIKFFY